jgi:hypothetical protein
MFSKSLLSTALVAGAIAAPAPAASSFGPDSQISASVQPTTTGYREEYLQSGYASATFHGPFSGTPTTTGAANGPTTLAASLGTLPPNPSATYYNTAGVPVRARDLLLRTHMLTVIEVEPNAGTVYPSRWSRHQWHLTKIHGRV